MDPIFELILAAQAVRKKAHAPYSHYQVGAAVRGANRKIYTGCNMENASYGATICAERLAIGAMVADGERAIESMAIATVDQNLPCGICLQVISEFATGGDPSLYLCSGEGNECVEMKFHDLLPRAFDHFSPG